LFTFLLAFRILEGENCLNEKLFEFFIKGPQLKVYDQIEQEILKRNDLSSEDENMVEEMKER
jgi:hypothetical protein